MINATVPSFDGESILTLGGRSAHHSKQYEPRPHTTRCLVVDDDRLILKYVVHMLSILGLQEVEAAQRFPEVMRKLLVGPYGLLITDLEMPDMNGFRLVQTIKEDARDMKTVIMTGRPKDDCFEMMAERRVDGWLFKPFDLEDMRSMLSEVGILNA